MGRSLRGFGFFAAAGEFYERAVQANESKRKPAEREAALREMGQSFLEVKDGRRAAAAFERGAREFPRSPQRAEMLLGLAQSYVLAGAKDKARQTMQTLAAEFPRSDAAREGEALLSGK
jgi:outer membrane protein assembly factor BamD (BamD/ComL family)